MISAQVAELVDALASGASGGNPVEVQVLSWAPDSKEPPKGRLFTIWMPPEGATSMVGTGKSSSSYMKATQFPVRKQPAPLSRFVLTRARLPSIETVQVLSWAPGFHKTLSPVQYLF